MDSEAHVDVARLFDMLDELDALYADSVTAVENRLAAAHSALEQAREIRAHQPEGAVSEPAAAGEQPSDHDALLDDVSQYMRRIEELESLLEGMADKDARIVELESVAQEIGKRDNQIADLTAENQRLHDMLVHTEHVPTSSAEASLEDFENRIQEREAQLDLLREQLEEARATLQQREERIRALEEQAASAKEEAQQQEALRAEIQDRDAQLDLLREQLEQSCRQGEETAQLREQLAQREAQLADAQTQYNQAKQALDAHEADDATLDTLHAERDALLGSVEALKQQRADREEALQAVSEERDALRDTINALETEKAARQSELEAVTAERDTLKESLAAHETQEKELRDTAAALKAEYDALNQESTAYKAERDAEIASLREKSKAALEADAQIKTLQQALDERAAHLTGLERTLSEVEEQRNKLELEVKMLVDQVESLQMHQEEAEQLKRRVEKLEIELEEELAIIIRLQAQLAAPGRAQAQAPETTRPTEGAVASKDMVSAVAATAGRNRRQRKQMGEILVEAGVLTREQLTKVIRAQNADPKRKLGAVVVEYGYANEQVIAAALAAQLHIRYIENLEREMELESVNLAPANLVKHHRCVPVYMDGGQLLLAMANPLDLIAIDDIELATNARVEPAVATPTDIDNVIEKFFEREHAISQARR